MKQFLLKLSIFLITSLGILHGLSYIAETVAPDGNGKYLQQDQQMVDELLAQANNLEAIAIGNSHSHSINFEALALNGYQMGRAANDFTEIRYYLEQMIPRLPKVNTVFMPISYFSFAWNNESLEETAGELTVRRTHMYYTLPGWRPIPGDVENFVIGKTYAIFPITRVLREDNWGGVVHAVLNDNEAADTALEEVVVEGPCGYPALDKLNFHAEFSAEEDIRRTQAISAVNPGVVAHNFETLSEIIEFLQAREIRIVFYTPPYYQAYTTRYKTQDGAAISTMQENMNLLQQRYDIEYYNLSADQEFAPYDHFFRDSDHFNLCGAKLFSTRIKDLMLENNHVMLPK